MRIMRLIFLSFVVLGGGVLFDVIVDLVFNFNVW